MNKRVISVLIPFIMVVGFALNAVAEPPYEIDRPLSKEQMAKVRERIETLRIWKLTKALDLDEKTSSQLFPILNRNDKRRAEIERALALGMRNLRSAVKDNRIAQLKDIIDDLERNHKALQNLNDEERTEVRKILTIEQQARFIIFQQEFSSELKQII
ncbi:MAG TPA: hypothetical protein VEE82_01705, partial [Thermodesulfovibrionales bacterium]|nr:hypothetical protein [Thermodesulfovibrionales bacterium]